MKLKVYNYKSQFGRYIGMHIDYPGKGIRKVCMIESLKKNWAGEWELLPAIQYSHDNGIGMTPLGPLNTVRFRWLKWTLLEITSWKEKLSDEEYIDKDSTADELTKGATWLDQENWAPDADQ